MDPTEEAARALDYGLPRSSLSLAGQLAYDRMVAAEIAHRAPGPTREENKRAELEAELARMGWSETTHTDLPVAQDGKQPQDALPGQPIARPYLLTFCLICSIVGAGLGAAKAANPSLNRGLVGLGLLSSLVAVILTPMFYGKQLRAVSRGILVAAAIFSIISVLVWGAIYCPDCPV